MIIEFIIPYIVGPKGNSKRAWKSGAHFTVTHDPKVAENAGTLASLCVPYIPAKPITGPVSATYEFTYPWRKPDQKRRDRGKLPARMPKATRPDTGQLIKQLDDVLQKCGFFADDAQIYHHDASKWYSDQSGVRVRLESCASDGGA